MATKEPERKVTPFSHQARYQLAETKKEYGWFKRMRRPSQFRHAIMKIYLTNARDYRLAQRLARALADIQTESLTAYPIANPTIGGDWRPFRVERGLTASMRGEIGGGKFSGTLTSSVLDSSSVILLENEKGQTMRALLPSPETAKEMLTRALANWRKHSGYVHDTYARRWYDENRDTHTSGVIGSFAMSKSWTRTLVHPEVIDMIDASCRKSEEHRPVINVQGTLIQKGVALATAIVVNGDQRVFVPTGFFRALTGAVKVALPREEEPHLLVA